jgi:hypothetical protein
MNGSLRPGLSRENSKLQHSLPIDEGQTKGGFMKKLTTLLLAIAIVLLAGDSFAPAQPQDPAKEEKPTFYRLTPGVYVNGYPRFTISYPKDWVEETPSPGEVLRAASPDPLHRERMIIAIGPGYPLDKFADYLVSAFKKMAQDVTVVSDKPSRLRDGTPAREVELQMVQNALPLNYFSLATNKGDMRVTTGVAVRGESIREDLRAIPYSIEFQQGKDEPVKVPPDIQEFLDKHCSNMVSHDLGKVMTDFSEKYLNSGERKGEAERRIRQVIGLITLFEMGITDLVTAGDRVHLTGFINANPGRLPLSGTSIIKENGEWKWYGNQRDISP